MNESAATNDGNGRSPSSLSIDALEEIVRNCQQNEQRLHELERHARHERKKAERLLRETSLSRKDRDNRFSSFLSNNSANQSNDNHNNSINDRPRTTAKSRQNDFYVSLDDDDDDDGNRRQQKKPFVMQDKHLLERVEKLLAGDGTTTSSDIMSSQERQRHGPPKLSSPVEDDLDDGTKEKHLDSKRKPPVHSIEDDLATVDRLISKRTPTNIHRVNLNVQVQREDKPKKVLDRHDLADIRDRKFYERLNNYVQTGRFGSSDREKNATTTDDETYQHRPMSISHSTQTTSKDDVDLADLARRCEDLLTRLQSERNRSAQLDESSCRSQHHHRRPTSNSSRERSYQPPPSPPPSPPPPPQPPAMSLQQALELLRPEFISRSRQRVRRVRLLREEREHNTEIERERRQMLLFPCTNCCSTSQRTISAAPSMRRNFSYRIPHSAPVSSRAPASYREMKKATKKKYDQLPEVNDRRLQNQMNDIRRRNVLRAKLFRARLRQHVARHGQTNINESLTMIDM